ncbi:MAG: T9SS type A sorting domain-containing protein [Bacteroidetes bacterium]|nr:T9SS type A sorting domain-containing protein [Bacteroidota bacterium]
MTSNLCPEVLYTYTSPSGCDQYGWTCYGCVEGTLNSARNIINVGTNLDGTLYAKVAWDNAYGGVYAIVNICDSLDVFTNSIQITSPSTICSTGVFSATLINPNPNSTITWSSDNAGLSIDSSTGYATRVNGYNGSANVTASYVCEINSNSSQGRQVWVGLPQPGSLNKNINSPPFCSGTERSVLINPEVGALSYDWSSNNTSILVVDGNGPNALLDAGYVGTCTLTVTITNTCGASSKNYFAVVSDCIGGGQVLAVYPNPASYKLMVQVTDSLSAAPQENVLGQPYEMIIMDRFSRKVYSMQSTEKTTEIPVGSLPPGLYYLNVLYNGTVFQKQIVIKR